MSKVIIQPSAEALAALLSVDGEVSLELRQSIVEEFASRHLRAVANDPAIAARLDELARALSAQVKEQITAQIGAMKQEGWRERFTLRDDIRREIDTHVAFEAKRVIDERIADTLAPRLDEIARAAIAAAERAMLRRIEQNIETLVKTEVARRLAAVQAAISGTIPTE